jgi:tetratricopeptide (TPR) repeat protein
MGLDTSSLQPPPEAAGRFLGAGPFVGRKEELKVLEAALDDACAGRGRLVLLIGEPGIGKTRTAEEAAALAEQKGMRVLWGRCYEGEGAPAFWPWVQVLSDCVRALPLDVLREALAPDVPELAHLVPLLAERLPEVTPGAPPESPGARFRLFESVASFLARAAEPAGLLLIIDDLHGADESSLLLPEHLARRLGDTRVLTVGGYRDVVLQAEHPLNHALLEVGRTGTCLRLTLGPLSDAEAAELVAIQAGGPLPQSVVAALQVRGEGNPLFLGELARELTATGPILGSVDPRKLKIPATLRAAIGKRLRTLSEPCQAALRVGALIGPEFEGRVVEAVLASSVDTAFAEAAAARVLHAVAEAPARWRFSHALICETLNAGLRPAERSELHRRIGEAMENEADQDRHLADLAHHFSRSGAQDKAILYAQRAGDRAMGLMAYEEAARLYRLGLATLSPSRDTAIRAALLVALGESLRNAGQLEESKRALAEGARMAREIDDRDLLARGALAYGSKLPWGEAPEVDDTLVQLLENALALRAEEQSVTRVRLLARLARALRFAPGSTARRASLGREAVEQARLLGEPRALADALDSFHFATFTPENAAERLALGEEVIRTGRQLGDLELEINGHLLLRSDKLEIGDCPGAYAHLDACRRLAARLRQPFYAYVCRGLEITALVAEGQFARAQEILPGMQAVGRQAVGSGGDLAFGALLFIFHRTQGRRENLTPIAEMFEALPSSPLTLLFNAAAASAYVELGRDEDAHRVWRSFGIEQLRSMQRDENWLPTVTFLAEAAALADDPSDPAAIYELLAPFQDRIAMSGGHGGYFGPVSHSLGLLAAAMGRPGDAVRNFEAALAINARMRARPWLARTQYALARTLLSDGATGDQARARELLAEARATARELDMSLLLERVEALAAGRQPMAVKRQRPARSDEDTSGSVFRFDDGYWTVMYGGTMLRLDDSKGLRYIAHLLRHPGQEFYAFDLFGQGTGLRAQGAGRGASAPAESEGRSPEPGNEEMERARSAVTKRIKAELRKIAAQNPALGRHLAAAIRTGARCSYRPEPPVTWQL